ncbi:hypothetical protein ACPPVQ_12355 [Diaminobutyricibacter sp. McL0618]|uniref:hypothetical protein n=1 Tax=Leifsonia sp. McL0618 TaxID=3415677 RepID=UPI003CEFBDF3
MTYNRVWALVSISLLVLLVATGCSASPTGGQSKEDALAQIQKVEGVESAFVDAGGSYNGFQRRTDVLISIWLAPGFKIASTHDLAEFLVRLAWSVNTEKPNTDLAFFLHGSEISDLESALTDAGWEFPSGEGSDFMSIPPAVVGAKLGRWPGPVPVTPDNMFVPDNTAPATPNPSAFDLAPRAALTVE